MFELFLAYLSIFRIFKILSGAMNALILEWCMCVFFLYLSVITVWGSKTFFNSININVKFKEKPEFLLKINF